MDHLRLFLVLFLVAAGAAVLAADEGRSVYTKRLDDPRAVYLEQPAFPVVGDGVADDTHAIQHAIDAVASTTGQGILFIPEGRYRITHTLLVYPGIRLIGYGAHRPVLLLGKDTPGFQSGKGKYMVWFTGGRMSDDGQIRDANPGTFYSAMSNIDIEIGDGNQAAIGVRSHWAQHCFLAFMDFHIGAGKAGIEQIGNFGQNLRFFGGDYGIITTKPSPSWPYALLDASFDGQRTAGIKTEEGGLTLIRNRFSNMPTCVSINENRAEELLMKDGKFQNISGPAVVINDFWSARTEVNLLNIALEKAPLLARYRELDKDVDTNSFDLVRRFTVGLRLPDLGGPGEVESRLEPSSDEPAPIVSDIPDLPDTGTWVNLRDFGAKGDGVTDDTDAFKSAISKAKTIYVPSGRYIVHDTLELRPDTDLIGLNPVTTQIALADGTPEFRGETAGFPGSPKPLLETPVGGTNIISGVALDTGGINPRAVAAKWQAGSRSYMNDVKFYGGHGSPANFGPRPAGGVGFGNVYNNNHTADPDLRKKWDAQYPSLWVTNGGGGTFTDIWTASTFAQAGMAVSDTSTPGRVYAMSSEHHVRNEIKLTRVSNWSIYALQMEEERGEGPNVQPLAIEDCSKLEFGNLYIYRVMSTYSPYPCGVRIRRSRDLQFYNVHTYGPSKFTVDDTVVDQTTGGRCRYREITDLFVSGYPVTAGMDRGSAVRTAGRTPQKLAGGFNNIDSLCTDASGRVYFVDARWQSIYRWSPGGIGLELLRDNALSPAAITVDRSGEVVVLTSTGSAYAFKPGTNDDQITVLHASPIAPPPGATAVIPGTRWRDAHDFLTVTQKPAASQFVSPDGSLFIPVGEDFLRAGPMSAMFSTIDLIRAYQLTQAKPGATVYIGDEFGQKTYAFNVNADGSLSLRDSRVFAEEGEAGVAVDSHGNVYVCAGNIFVYNANGVEIDQIEVPMRPTSIAFGGPDGKTLFIGARSSLYSIRLK